MGQLFLLLPVSRNCSAFLLLMGIASREGDEQGDRVRVPLVASVTVLRAEEPGCLATLPENPGLICSPRGRQSDFQTQLPGTENAPAAFILQDYFSTPPKNEYGTLLVFFPRQFSKCRKQWWKFMSSKTEMSLTDPGQIT